MPTASDEIERNTFTKEEKQREKCQTTCRELAAGKNRLQLQPLVLWASQGSSHSAALAPQDVPSMKQHTDLVLVDLMTHLQAG